MNRSIVLCLPLLLLALAAPAVRADEAPQAMPPRDAAASKEHFETAKVALEELRLGDAATSYWKAVAADQLNYPAQVRMMSTRLEVGDKAEDIHRDIATTLEEFPHLVDLKLHLLRLESPRERLPKLLALEGEHAENGNLMLEIGRAMLAIGQAKEALPKLEQATQKLPVDRTDAWFLWIRALRAAGTPLADVLEHVKKVTDERPESFDVWLLHAELMLEAGDTEAAAASLQRVVTLRPTYVAAWMLTSEMAVQAGKQEEALTAIDKARRIAPKAHPVLLAHAGLLTRYESGEEWAKRAKTLIDEVLAKDDENVRAFYLRGWVDEKLQEYSSAEKSYREVLLFQPRHVEAINSIGICLLKQGRLAEAQGQFRKATDLDEDFIEARLNLGSTYDAQAKYNDAIEIYEDILKDKKHKDNLRAIINCAFNYEAVTNYNKAYKLLKEAEKLKPSDPEIKIWLGDNAFFRKKWKNAEKHYLSAIDLDEKQFFAWRGLGLCLTERRKWKEAADALEKAMALKGDDPEVLYTLGTIYASELEQLERALELFRALEATGQGGQAIADVIAQLEADIERKRK